MGHRGEKDQGGQHHQEPKGTPKGKGRDRHQGDVRSRSAGRTDRNALRARLAAQEHEAPSATQGLCDGRGQLDCHHVDRCRFLNEFDHLTLITLFSH
jgi:hypothetical protein